MPLTFSRQPPLTLKAKSGRPSETFTPEQHFALLERRCESDKPDNWLESVWNAPQVVLVGQEPTCDRRRGDLGDRRVIDDEDDDRMHGDEVANVKGWCAAAARLPGWSCPVDLSVTGTCFWSRRQQRRGVPPSLQPATESKTWCSSWRLERNRAFWQVRIGRSRMAEFFDAQIQLRAWSKVGAHVESVAQEVVERRDEHGAHRHPVREVVNPNGGGQMHVQMHDLVQSISLVNSSTRRMDSLQPGDAAPAAASRRGVALAQLCSVPKLNKHTNAESAVMMKGIKSPRRQTFTVYRLRCDDDAGTGCKPRAEFKL